jgi:ABC-type multidrug transport system ATPase subunit
MSTIRTRSSLKIQPISHWILVSIHKIIGKTTLLKALAGKSQCDGILTLNGEPFDPILLQNQQRVAFVADKDAFEETATGFETIFFSARLRLPSATSDDNVKEVVDKIIHDLRLDRCMDTQCRFMSSGERRRLSLAVEMVASPIIVLLDEPTSGLDR